MSEDTTVKRKGISKKKEKFAMIIAIISVIIIAFVFGIKSFDIKTFI